MSRDRAVTWTFRHTAEPTPAGVLDGLLRDASAPGSPDELAGLPDALRAYRTAHPARRRTSMLGKLLAAKVLVGTVAATSMGGVALAASQGDLPAPVQDVVHSAVDAAPAGHHAHSQGHGKGLTKHHDNNGNADTPDASASPTPNLKGLCQAYLSGVRDSSGKALENPAFSYLFSQAKVGGTTDKATVTTYCNGVIAADKAKHAAKHDNKPDTKGKSADHKPATHSSSTNHPGAPTHP